jgi:cation-transporting ATPase 13A3/4/5
MYSQFHDGQISDNDFAYLKECFGPSGIKIARPNIFGLMIDEVLTPFYLFQYFSMAIWFAEEYIKYTIALLVITVFCQWLSMFDAWMNNKRIRDMAEFSVDVIVLRNGQQVTTTNHNLVPGDIIVISAAEAASGMLVPCDMLLLEGKCVANESILTGESVPVIKS